MRSGGVLSAAALLLSACSGSTAQARSLAPSESVRRDAWAVAIADMGTYSKQMQESAAGHYQDIVELLEPQCGTHYVEARLDEIRESVIAKNHSKADATLYVADLRVFMRTGLCGPGYEDRSQLPFETTTQPLLTEAATTGASPTTTTTSTTTAATPTTPEPASPTVAETTTQSEVPTSPSIPEVATSTASFDVTDEALEAAQTFVNAVADQQWDIARLVSPEYPPWSDAKYESGFRGFLGATLYVGDSAFVSGAVELWIAEVASEQRNTGLQTTLYCVHWEYSLTVKALDRLHGKTIRTIPGAVDPSTLQAEGTTKCNRHLVP